MSDEKPDPPKPTMAEMATELLLKHSRPGIKTLVKDEIVLKTKSSPVTREYVEYRGKLLVYEVWTTKTTTRHAKLREAGQYETALQEFVDSE